MENSYPLFQTQEYNMLQKQLLDRSRKNKLYSPEVVEISEKLDKLVVKAMERQCQ